MAQISGTTDTTDIIGMAEDIEDMIYTITPTQVPMFTLAKRGKATAVNHQWQTDDLAVAALNAQIEGDDASYTTASPTTMLSNRTMISRKTLLVSRTADRVKKYGRAREFSRLTAKYMKELKRDIEVAFVGVQGSSAGGNGTARYAAGFGAMVAGNAYKAAGTASTAPGYAGGDWGASVNGTATSAMTEGHLKAALELTYVDGGEPTVIMMNTVQKKAAAAFSGATKFAGNYTQQGRTMQGVVVGGVDLYISDFGEHKLVLNRHMGQGRVYCIDPDFIEMAWLDPIKLEPLAKTGDAEKAMMVGEYTFVLGNPDAHAQIYGLATS